MDPPRVTRQTLTFGIARVASAKALVPDPVTAIQEGSRTEGQQRLLDGFQV